MITSGASGGLTLLAALLLNPEDELLITDPGYPCNDVFARLVGARPRPINVDAENRFQPTFSDFVDAWGVNTRAALLAFSRQSNRDHVGSEGFGGYGWLCQGVWWGRDIR